MSKTYLLKFKKEDADAAIRVIKMILGDSKCDWISDKIFIKNTNVIEIPSDDTVTQGILYVDENMKFILDSLVQIELMLSWEDHSL